MKSQIISTLTGIVVGTGATLGLLTFTGTTDLQEIQTLVQEYTGDMSNAHANLYSEYNVQVDKANAEIGDYKAALEQANKNILALSKAYTGEVSAKGDLQERYDDLESDLIWTQGQLQDKKDEIETLEQDLSDIKAQVETTKAQVDADVAKLVEEANAEIRKANEEVASTKQAVQGYIDNAEKPHMASKEVDTSGTPVVEKLPEGVTAE